MTDHTPILTSAQYWQAVAQRTQHENDQLRERLAQLEQEEP